ncbi:glycoside hydrolase family 15 protein [bacterium]|nr:glycoside hydrolase family 15 protein [bacterium]
MPRHLVLGNGRILVCLDHFSQLKDFYYPYIGLFNHIMGNTCRIGVWDGSQISWAGDDWEVETGYEPYALIGYTRCKLPNGIEINFKTAVHPLSNIFLREIEVKSDREITLFFHHNFSISETDVGDTAFYNPFLNAIIQFKRDVYILASAMSPQGGIAEYSIGTKQGDIGTWKDAEDGKLSMRSIEQGAVDSVFALRFSPFPQNNRALTWVVVGSSLGEITALNELVREKGSELLRETYSYWTTWLRGILPDFLDLPDDIAELFRKSVLIARTHIDNGGAIIAANDSDIMETARAHYSYMWGRDSAFTVLNLDKLGLIDISRRFFLFIKKLLQGSFPFLWHKYSADGSLGSSWHPWLIDGEKEIPLQQDSTAIVIYALQQHFKRYGDLEFLSDLYEIVVRNPARFMCHYIEEGMNLPRPSWDLWEERRGIHLYTSAVTALSLFSAAELASAIGDIENSKLFFSVGRQLWYSLSKFFKGDRCVRSFIPKSDGWFEDDTPDASIFLLPLLNIKPIEGVDLASYLINVENALWVKTPIGGLSRYKGDWYFRRVYDEEKVPGNPWYICTMWLAEWYIEQAKTIEELKQSLSFFKWAKLHALPSGIFPEQVHPITGEPLSVAPLTWSHISFISAVLHYLEKRKEV